MPSPNTRTFVDLFCGCGGFTLGLQRAGMRCLGAIDCDTEAMKVFKANFPDVPCALERDLTKFSPADLAGLLEGQKIDVIVGGLPCQGFSTVRQVDAANHGSRVKRDKRRYLYRVFLDYVRFFQPQLFVIENVPGIQTAAKGKFFTRVQAEARALGYRVHSQVEKAWRLGVPQKRRRQLIIGVRADLPAYFPARLEPASRAWTRSHADEVVTIWDAIGDLQPLAAGGGSQEQDYDLERRRRFIRTRGNRAKHYLENVLEILRAEKLTAHQARPHSPRDVRDFARLREGEHSGDAEDRGEKLEFPYSRQCFRDRYKRQHREQLCSTIVAHLSKDGLMFIHPTQDRSLTPREAARLQSLPDWFHFPVTRTHQFRLIGNAVPPLVAEAVGEQIQEFLNNVNAERRIVRFELLPLPRSEEEAVEWLRPLLDLSMPALRRLGPLEFRRAWYSIAFLHPGLHPDSALDHGERIVREPNSQYGVLARIEPRLFTPYYERSGWPIALAPIAREAWRRRRKHELADDEFYCSEATMAGLCIRNPSLRPGLCAERI